MDSILRQQKTLASGSNTFVIAPVTGFAIKVLGLVISGDAAQAGSLTFNSDNGAGGLTQIFAKQNVAVNGNISLPHNEKGWMVTKVNEGLSITVGGSGTPSVQILYALETEI